MFREKGIYEILAEHVVPTIDDSLVYRINNFPKYEKWMNGKRRAEIEYYGLTQYKIAESFANTMVQAFYGDMNDEKAWEVFYDELYALYYMLEDDVDNTKTFEILKKVYPVLLRSGYVVELVLLYTEQKMKETVK